jgi:hypothetical protein
MALWCCRGNKIERLRAKFDLGAAHGRDRDLSAPFDLLVEHRQDDQRQKR